MRVGHGAESRDRGGPMAWRARRGRGKRGRSSTAVWKEGATRRPTLRIPSEPPLDLFPLGCHEGNSAKEGAKCAMYSYSEKWWQ
ncbi:hypothetical protein E2C01_084781 [Portunus trituberculatus]|uniref:Uncharacterized protein n=1 Tax=Portunus trituberculatus TaxID=210409 RepID=A0A5B7IW87_PORTR|nr:hypothetical protein [Portunus trituberculatus]